MYEELIDGILQACLAFARTDAATVDFKIDLVQAMLDIMELYQNKTIMRI